MPKVTVDQRSLLAFAPGRLNAMRVLEDELQLLRQQSQIHPEYIALLPGMELELNRLRQTVSSMLPAAEPEPEPTRRMITGGEASDPDKLRISYGLAKMLDLLKNGPITKEEAGRILGSSPGAITQRVGKLRKAGIDIVCLDGLYQLVNPPEDPPPFSEGPAPDKSKTMRLIKHALSHKGVIQRKALEAAYPDQWKTFLWVIGALRNKFGWVINTLERGAYQVVKQGRIPGPQGPGKRKITA